MFLSIEDKNTKKSNKNSIEVISKKEFENSDIYKIFNLDKKISFKIKGFSSIKPELENNIDRVWFLEIESKDLEDFRYFHHLSPKKNLHNFNLVIGIKKGFKLRQSYPTMKIKSAFSAA